MDAMVDRIRRLNNRPAAKGRYVVYLMQQSQRAQHNAALELAVQRANELHLPLIACFGLDEKYPQANIRHYAFMLQGLRETSLALKDRGIDLVVRFGKPDDVALSLSDKAATVVCDKGYLRHQRKWRTRIARLSQCETVEVDADTIVPVEIASTKPEYAARTIRPKLLSLKEKHLVLPQPLKLRNKSLGLHLTSLDISDARAVIDRLNVDRSVPPSEIFVGGASVGEGVLRNFIEQGLPKYVMNRNRPGTDDVSHMSMYLHYGQISPIYIAQQIEKAADVASEIRAAYIEELLVRRELAINFVYYTKNYDKYGCLPAWARQTLRKHRSDRRKHHYTRRELEEARTHDPYWNASMQEMKLTGYMHNYMRMYWGKKILEWRNTPQDAFRVTLELNNKYFLDGRDASAYANVAWIFGMHDRPWKERDIFGTVRYMSASGLERKADPESYLHKVDTLARTIGRS